MTETEITEEPPSQRCGAEVGGQTQRLASQPAGVLGGVA